MPTAFGLRTSPARSANAPLRTPHPRPAVPVGGLNVRIKVPVCRLDSALPGAAILSRRYKDLRTPAIIIGGDGDKVARFEDQSAALHAMVPGSELITVPGAGHMVHYAAPDTVIAAVDQAAALSERGAEVPAP